MARRHLGRASVADLPTGPKDAKSTVLSLEEESIIVAFRQHTLLPLDDCLYALMHCRDGQPTIPHLSRSSLHRCLARHGISRLPDVQGDKPDKKKFKSCPELAEGATPSDTSISGRRQRRKGGRLPKCRLPTSKLYLYVAPFDRAQDKIDRTSKFAFVQLVEEANRVTASSFSDQPLSRPCPRPSPGQAPKIHTILTDNGVQFTYPPRYAKGPTATYMTHMFDMTTCLTCPPV